MRLACMPGVARPLLRFPVSVAAKAGVVAGEFLGEGYPIANMHFAKGE